MRTKGSLDRAVPRASWVLQNKPLALLLGLLMTALLIWAQAETGRITGSVRDASGAAVPKAAVAAKNVDTGAVRSTTGSGEGSYLIPSVVPGTYEVTITAQGFSAFKQKVTVGVGSAATVDAKLEVGTSTTLVEVAENAVAVNTETQSLTNMVSTAQVLELPSVTRNPYDFVATMPNVAPDVSDRGVGYAINGLRSAGTIENPNPERKYAVLIVLIIVIDKCGIEMREELSYRSSRNRLSVN